VPQIGRTCLPRLTYSSVLARMNWFSLSLDSQATTSHMWPCLTWPTKVNLPIKYKHTRPWPAYWNCNGQVLSRLKLSMLHDRVSKKTLTNYREKQEDLHTGEKSSISTRKSTTRFPTSYRWTVCVTPKSPKGWHKTQFCCFCQWNSTSIERSLLQSFFVWKLPAAKL